MVTVSNIIGVNLHFLLSLLSVVNHCTYCHDGKNNYKDCQHANYQYNDAYCALTSAFLIRGWCCIKFMEGEITDSGVV